MTGPPVRDVILVTSPHAGRTRRLARARQQLRAAGIRVHHEMSIDEAARLPALLVADPAVTVVAAGGDGTVGTVAHHLADTGVVLGVLPLGTSNDFARSLGIPTAIGSAVALLSTGKVATIDLGRLSVPGQPPRHFAHAATAGFNVAFAELATRASLRRRLRWLTYAAAAAMAARTARAFDCQITHDGHTEQLRLTQLAIINAPVFGGFLGLRVEAVDLDDRRLDILTVEPLPVRRIALAVLYALLRIPRPISGIRAVQVRALHLHTPGPCDIALDGEVIARAPATFDVAGEALRIITPPTFLDIDE